MINNTGTSYKHGGFIKGRVEQAPQKLSVLYGVCGYFNRTQLLTILPYFLCFVFMNDLTSPVSDLTSPLQVPDEVSGKIFVLVAEQQRDGVTPHAGSSRSPHPMRMSVDVSSHVVVDHRADVGEVQTASYMPKITQYKYF